MNLSAELAIIATLLRGQGREYLADVAAIASRVVPRVKPCADCGSLITDDRCHRRCLPCSVEHRRAYHRAVKQRRRDAKTCPECGTPVTKFVYCVTCRARKSKRTRRAA